MTIKNYFTTSPNYGKRKKMATIICDNCNKEFQVDESVANNGRRYCDKICSNEGRGFK